MPRAETTNGRRNRRGRRARLPIALGFFLSIGVAWAGGPRWVTGPPYFTGPAGNAVVWNVPTAAMAMAYGGALQEHVSGANAYLGSNGPVFPQDVQRSEEHTSE